MIVRPRHRRQGEKGMPCRGLLHVRCVQLVGGASLGPVELLQRTLKNGVGMRHIEVDGLFGPRTKASYRIARTSAASAHGRPGQLLGHPGIHRRDVGSGKYGVMLLHQYGMLPDQYGLKDRRAIEGALTQVSRSWASARTRLRSEDLERLYRRYRTDPPEGTLSAALKDQGLPFEGLEIHFQAYKREQEVRVFARAAGSDAPFAFLKTYEITAQPLCLSLGRRRPEARGAQDRRR